MGIKPEDIARAIADGNKFMAQLRKAIPNPAEQLAAAYQFAKDAKAAKPANRIRQDINPLLNKLEADWLAVIKDQHPNYPPIRSQAKRYEIARGAWYKPDFTCSIWPVPNGAARETAWECKGPKQMENWQKRGFIVLKAAARQWPEVRFVLVWREGGQWREQEVLP